MVYGQYSSVLMHDCVWTTALSCSILTVHHQPSTHKVPYCYYKLVTYVIRAVKNMFCHTRDIGPDIPRLLANQHSSLEQHSF